MKRRHGSHGSHGYTVEVPLSRRRHVIVLRSGLSDALGAVAVRQCRSFSLVCH